MKFTRGIHIPVHHGSAMRNALAAAICLLLSTTMMIPSAGALPASEVDNGMLFGGQWSPTGNATTVNDNLSDLNAVVEVFTATWCENCVDVEHALDDVQSNGLLQQYHIHRAIGETQDPFGTEDLDYRWRNKYGASSPPAVVFNGTMKKIGSVADEGTLENEFSNLARMDLGLGSGSSSFAWTPTSSTAGTVSWALDLEAYHLDNATLNVTAWIVEAAADFEDGSNGLGTYPHIVHDIQVLGHELNGTATVNIPTAHDGDDLQVHLLYEVIPNEPEPEPVVNTDDDENEDTPALSVLSTVLVLTLAAAFSRGNSSNPNQRSER